MCILVKVWGKRLFFSECFYMQLFMSFIYRRKYPKNPKQTNIKTEKSKHKPLIQVAQGHV